MGKYIKIHSISTSVLNNTEYLNLMKRFRPIIPNGQPDTGGGEEERPGELSLGNINTMVGISDEELAAFDADIALMEDIVKQSRISNETAKIDETDKVRAEQIVYFNGEVSNGCKCPIPEIREAANQLYNVTKGYVGIQKLGHQQTTQQTNGLLKDVDKPENKALVATLHLQDVVELLRTTNQKMEELTNNRTKAKAAAATDNAKTIRARLDPLFDDMLTIAFVYSVAYPTDETATFVTNVNALIDEVKFAYNQRKGLAAYYKNKGKPGGGGDDERPGEL